MSYIGKNIKRIRTVKKLSQAQFAELFKLARPSVGAYEEGRSEPKIDTILSIAHHFGISVDALLRKELSVNELYSLDILKGEFDPTRLPPALGNGSKDEQLPLKPEVQASPGLPVIYQDNQLEYIVNLHSRDFLNALPRILLPEHPGKTNRVFQHSGHAMLTSGGGLHEGDLVTTVQVPQERWQKLEEQKLFVVVSPKNISIRRFRGWKDKESQWQADNPEVEAIALKKEEILEIWQVTGHWSTYLEQPNMLEHKMLSLEHKLKEVMLRVEELEKGK